MEVLNELDSTCGITDDELTRLFKESIRIDDEIIFGFWISNGHFGIPDFISIRWLIVHAGGDGSDN